MRGAFKGINAKFGTQLGPEDVPTLGIRVLKAEREFDKKIEVELRDGATVNDLLVLLEISESQRAVVAIDSRIQKANDRIRFGAHAQVFQPVHGV